MQTRDTGLGCLEMMTRIHDNMVIPTLDRKHHGSNRNHSSGTGGHFRPPYHYSCSAHLLWSGLLGYVGDGLGESDNSCNLCHIQLSNGENQGEVK